jgi:hypothetical protein
MVTVLTPEGGSVVAAVRVLACVAVLSALLVLLLPETAQRELEDISRPVPEPR